MEVGLHATPPTGTCVRERPSHPTARYGLAEALADSCNKATLVDSGNPYPSSTVQTSEFFNTTNNRCTGCLLVSPASMRGSAWSGSCPACGCDLIGSKEGCN